MTQGYYFKSMRINEKGYFAIKVLNITEAMVAKDPEFKALYDEVKLQNDELDRATSKLSVADLTELMVEDDDLRDSALANIKDQAQICAQRKNPEIAQAGKLVVSTIKSIDWNMQQRGNAEETALMAKLLDIFDTNAAVKQALATIDATEFVDDMRTGQAMYIAHDKNRTSAKGQNVKTTSKLAARELGVAIDKLFRYIDFMVDFRNNPDYLAISNNINAAITEAKSKVTQRETRAENAKNKEGEAGMA